MSDRKIGRLLLIIFILILVMVTAVVIDPTTLEFVIIVMGLVSLFNLSMFIYVIIKNLISK